MVLGGRSEVGGYEVMGQAGEYEAKSRGGEARLQAGPWSWEGRKSEGRRSEAAGRAKVGLTSLSTNLLHNIINRIW